MTAKEFISYVRGLTDMEVSRVEGQNGTPTGYLKLLQDALEKLDLVSDPAKSNYTKPPETVHYDIVKTQQTGDSLKVLNKHIKQLLKD